VPLPPTSTQAQCMTVTISRNDIEQNNREAGFTVVEVVAALTILSLALAVLLNIMSNSIGQTSRAETATQAEALALSLLAKIGTELPLRDGEITGQADEQFHWHVYIAPYGDGSERREWPVAAHQVSAEVLWRDGVTERSLALTTLRLGPKESAL
jgi:general secretion pathway protein I